MPAVVRLGAVIAFPPAHSATSGRTAVEWTGGTRPSVASAAVHGNPALATRGYVDAEMGLRDSNLGAMGTGGLHLEVPARRLSREPWESQTTKPQVTTPRAWPPGLSVGRAASDLRCGQANRNSRLPGRPLFTEAWGAREPEVGGLSNGRRRRPQLHLHASMPPCQAMYPSQHAATRFALSK